MDDSQSETSILMWESLAASCVCVTLTDSKAIFNPVCVCMCVCRIATAAMRQGGCHVRSAMEVDM